MEIGPIAGIRSFSSIPAKSNGIDLPEIFQVADSARAGDETYNGSARQSAGGQDDEESELDTEIADEGLERSGENGSGVQISFFA